MIFLNNLTVVITAAPSLGINPMSISSRVFIIILQIKLTEILAAASQTAKYLDSGFLLYKNKAYKIPENPTFKSNRGLNVPPPENNRNPSIFVKTPAENPTTGPNINAADARNKNPNLISRTGPRGIISILLPITVREIKTAASVIVLAFLKFEPRFEIPSRFKILLMKIPSRFLYDYDLHIIIQQNQKKINYIFIK